MSIAVFSHSDCLRHDTGSGHPESVERLPVILAALKSSDFSRHLEFLEAPAATKVQVLLVHTPAHYERVQHAVSLAGTHHALDPDTIISEGSLQAALHAVGAGCEAVDKVLGGTYSSAFCAVRPPGHHAIPSRAMGFCLFNNIAIAAAHAMSTHGLKRVAIVDFDVHHGNGTQDAFEQDKRVLYISTHQRSHYPGTGNENEQGAGNILNLPLPAGTDGGHYREVFSSRVIPAIEAFEPQLILVSAGFDAHRNDPLAGFMLMEEDYQWIGEQLRNVAEKCCEGKVVSFLEGGYWLPSLAASTASYLSAFAA
ncbi:MAG TPA: histone deacetylase family protein [Rickettsiales bacterium]|nr:histone deacetylase family protein [Rickettsiales bacterium]